MADYYEKMTRPRKLTPEDEDKLRELLRGPTGAGPEPGGQWMEALLHLAEAQRLMETMTLPFPRELEMGSVADPYMVLFKAAAESIRAHYLLTLRLTERTPVRVVIDENGHVHVERDWPT
jgi:hypothetical protein